MHTIILIDACLPPLRGVEHGSSVEVLILRDVPELNQRSSDTKIGKWAITKARLGIRVVILTRDQGFEQHVMSLDRSSMRASIHILAIGPNFARALRGRLIERMVRRLNTLERRVGIIFGLAA